MLLWLSRGAGSEGGGSAVSLLRGTGWRPPGQGVRDVGGRKRETARRVSQECPANAADHACGGKPGDARKTILEQMRGRGAGALRQSWLERRGRTGLGQKSFRSCHVHLELNAHDAVGCLVQLRAPSSDGDASESQWRTVIVDYDFPRE